MLKRRRLSGAALPLLLALAGFPGSLAAQDAYTFGNPQLKNFSLPWTRTTPPPHPAHVTAHAPPLADIGPAAWTLLPRRRRRGVVREAPPLLETAAPAPRPAPDPHPPATVESPPESAKRALLEVDIQPQRASALEDGAIVHYA